MRIYTLKRLRAWCALPLILEVGTLAIGASWVQDLKSPIVASPLVRDIDGDGKKEILISSLDGRVFLLDHEGNTLPGWPRETAILQQTAPNLGDIDGDGLLDVVIGDSAGGVHAWSLSGAPKNGFPLQLDGTIKSKVRLIDFDLDGRAEMLIHTGASRLYLIDGFGRTRPGWPQDLGGEEDRFGKWIKASSPTVLDLDLDGRLEIVIGTAGQSVEALREDGSKLPGWPAEVGGWVYPNIIAADLDGDHGTELITASADGTLHVWTGTGKTVSGFPIAHPEAIVADPALGELSLRYEGPEIVVADLSGAVYCYSSRGKLLPGWPRRAGAGIVAAPVFVDITGDGRAEILVASRDNRIHIWDVDGERIEVPGLSAQDWIESTPVVDDIDQDQTQELLFASYDGRLRCVELPGRVRLTALVVPGLHPAADRPSYDQDRDGLPDSLELSAFGGLHQNGGDDSDRDGVSNAAEWTAGTAPNDARDSLRPRLILTGSAGHREMYLEWTGKAGRTYTIERIELSDSGYTLGRAATAHPRIACAYDQTIQYLLHDLDVQKPCFFRVSVDRD